MTSGTIPLTDDQLKTLKDIIESQKQRLIFKGIYRSEEFNLDLEDRSDEIDHANADVSNAERLRFRNREVFYVKKLNEALKRIENGEYAQCTECGSPIRFERLLARPTADLCIACKEESEREETNNYIARQSKSLGKRIDLVNFI